MHQLFDPLQTDLRRLSLVKDEPQGNRRVNPDCRTPCRITLRMCPRQREALVASQLRRDDDFQVRESTILDMDRIRAVAVHKTRHEDHPTYVSAARTCTRLPAGGDLFGARREHLPKSIVSGGTWAASGLGAPQTSAAYRFRQTDSAQELKRGRARHKGRNRLRVCSSPRTQVSSCVLEKAADTLNAVVRR